MDERLRPGRRIRKRAEFVRAYDQGVKRHGRYVIVFVVPAPGVTSRLGVSVTRKYGGAVERNRAKRRVREIFRRTPVPPGLDVVVVPKREFPDASFADLDADLRATLARTGPSRRGVATAGGRPNRPHDTRRRPGGDRHL